MHTQASAGPTKNTNVSVKTCSSRLSAGPTRNKNVSVKTCSSRLSTGPTRNTSVSVKTYSSQVSAGPTRNTSVSVKTCSSQVSAETQVSQVKPIADMCNIASNDAFNSDLKDYSYCLVPQEVYWSQLKPLAWIINHDLKIDIWVNYYEVTFSNFSGTILIIILHKSNKI